MSAQNVVMVPQGMDRVLDRILRDHNDILVTMEALKTSMSANFHAVKYDIGVIVNELKWIKGELSALQGGSGHSMAKFPMPGQAEANASGKSGMLYQSAFEQ